MNTAFNGPKATPHVAVVQDGARLHYAVPLALHRAGMLDRMFTEWYSRGEAALAARLVGLWDRTAGAKLNGRYCADIPEELIRTNSRLAIKLRMARRRFQDRERYFEWCSTQVADWVRSAGWGKADALFGFVRNIHPSLCESARQDGLSVIADQMCAPAFIESRYVHAEQERWPEWVSREDQSNAGFVSEIEHRTWAATDRVTCASTFVRDALIESGVSAANISINPYPMPTAGFEVMDRTTRSQCVTIGYIGRVGLRKGAPWFLAVARRIAARGVRFIMVGSIDVPQGVLGELSRAVELFGAVPRSRVRSLLGQMDLFFFPAICEGSSGVVMEAMAAGLPVVTTPNSGSLVVDGVHGFIRQSDDVNGMAEAVERLIRDPELRAEMGRAGREEVLRNDVDAYAVRLRECLERQTATNVGVNAGVTSSL